MRQVLALAVLLAGCTETLSKSADFDRHRYSELVQPRDHPDRIYFDVIFSSDFPADEPAADKARMVPAEVVAPGATMKIADLAALDKVTVMADGFAPLELEVK